MAVALAVLLRSRTTRGDHGPPDVAVGPPADDQFPVKEEPPRELLAAWVEFLKDDLARAVNALNNRLNAIAALAEGVAGANLTDEQREQAQQIRTEVRRAAKITRGLLRRVTAMAPDTLPNWYGELEVSTSARAAHVLVVEDDASNRRVIDKLFTKLGHRVISVSNGFEAFELLERTAFDCIICDLRMPSLSGRTLFEQVEERLPHLTRRFVFVTGDYTRPSSREFLDRTGCPVVAKPYAVEELLAAAAEVLAGAGVLVRGI